MLRPSIRNNKKNNVQTYEDPFDFMDHMFDDFWGTGLESTSNMRTDVIEEEKDYKLQADLPGFDKKEINISLDGDVLKISASHQDKNEKKDKNYLRRERRYASYERSFHVENLKPEDISASYENGVLTVTVPKKEPEVPKTQRIEIG